MGEGKSLVGCLSYLALMNAPFTGGGNPRSYWSVTFPSAAVHTSCCTTPCCTTVGQLSSYRIAFPQSQISVSLSFSLPPSVSVLGNVYICGSLAWGVCTQWEAVYSQRSQHMPGCLSMFWGCAAQPPKCRFVMLK